MMEKPENQPPQGPPATHHDSPEASSSAGYPAPASPVATGRKRSGSGGSILSKFPFMRTSESRSNLRESRSSASSASPESSPGDDEGAGGSGSGGGSSTRAGDKAAPRAASLQQHHQQQKTRKRKGSLRKVALLGRGAAREKREPRALVVDTALATSDEPHATTARAMTTAADSDVASLIDTPSSSSTITRDTLTTGSGLGITGIISPSPADTVASTSATATDSSLPAVVVSDNVAEPQVTSPSSNAYASTTDEEGISMTAGPRMSNNINNNNNIGGGGSTASLQSSSFSSISDSYFPRLQPPWSTSTSLQRKRSVKKSPLSLQGLPTSPLPPGAAGGAVVGLDDHLDYSETEWWGWVVLVVTWFVFVIGMGSCLGVWSWAWDVGTTPYAPPELEDDPTLPIVGYYPALIILTCVMAWVWVIVAWVGMKYFRHAQIGSGD